MKTLLTTLSLIVALTFAAAAANAAKTPKVDDAALARLSEKFDDACVSDSLTWVPEQSRLVLTGKINDKPAVFMVDSGARGTVITLKSAREKGLPIFEGNGKFSGAGGSGKVFGTLVQRLQLGGSSILSKQRAMAIDLPVLVGIDGLLGGSTLLELRAIVDYRRRMFQVPRDRAKLDVTKLATEAGLNVVKLEREGTYVFVEAMIGSERLRLLVDTGAQRTLLGTDAAKRAGLQLRDTKERLRGAGEGAGKLQVATVSRMILGTTAFRDLECLATPVDYLGSYSKKAIHGILGADCLEASGALLSFSEPLLGLTAGDVVVPTPSR